MIITASSIDFWQPSRHSHRGFWFVCLSFLLHVLIICLLSHRNSEQPVVASSKAIQVIEATLIFSKLAEIQSQPSTSQQMTKVEKLTEEKRIGLSETQPILIPTKPLNEKSQPERIRRAKGSSSQKLTQRYMQQQNTEQLNGLIEQEVKQYRQYQNSPDLEIPAFEPNAEQQRQTKPKIIACDKTAAKIFAFVGNSMGGKMRCRDKPNIDEFINRRLNKS